MSALVLLVCYVAGSWMMPEGWEVTKIENRPQSAAVYLQRRVPDGTTIQVPVGCVTEEPKPAVLQFSPGSQLYLPDYAVPNALPNALPQGGPVMGDTRPAPDQRCFFNGPNSMVCLDSR